MTSLSKSIKTVLIIIFSLIVIFYAGVRIFVKSQEVKVDKTEFTKSITVFLSDEQIKTASLVLNKNNNPEFHNYFFLFNDAFSKRNNVALLAAINYLATYDEFRQQRSFNSNIVSLATKRYIMKKIDYVDCYNYLFSKAYFGNKIYGLSNAAEFYYSKSYSELSDEEFTNLCTFLTNPVNSNTM